MDRQRAEMFQKIQERVQRAKNVTQQCADQIHLITSQISQMEDRVAETREFHFKNSLVLGTGSSMLGVGHLNRSVLSSSSSSSSLSESDVNEDRHEDFNYHSRSSTTRQSSFSRANRRSIDYDPPSARSKQGLREPNMNHFNLLNHQDGQDYFENGTSNNDEDYDYGENNFEQLDEDENNSDNHQPLFDVEYTQEWAVNKGE